MIWVHGNGSSRCYDRVSGDIVRTKQGGDGTLLALDGQLIRLCRSSVLGWQLEGFNTSRADSLVDEEPKPLGVDEPQPFSPLLPPLAVTGYGLLIAVTANDLFGVVGFRDA